MARGNRETTGRQDRSQDRNMDDPTREREGEDLGPDTANDAGVGADDDDDLIEMDEDDDEAEDEDEDLS